MENESQEIKRNYNEPRELMKGSKADVLASRIEELRKENYLTLQRLADLVGVGKSTIAGYEGGYRFPSIDKLDVLAKVLNTSTDYLLGVTDNKYPKDLHQYLEESDLVYDGQPLTTEQIETLNHFLRSFVKNESKKETY